MSNSPPSAKGGSSSTSSTKRRSTGGGGTNKSSNKTPKGTSKNALSAFGFTSKKKRPAADNTAAFASSDAVVDLSMTASSSPSSDIEIVTSPSKRVKVDEQERRSTTTTTLTSTASKIGKGKENGTTKKDPSSTVAAVMGLSVSSSSATPAKNGKQLKSSSSAVKSASKSSGGSQRSALLDLTQDSSSDSMDVKLPANSAAVTAATSSSTAAGGGGSTKQSKPSGAISLANLAGGLAGKLLATTSTHQKNQQQKQQQQQRRGKRDRQHPSTKQQQQQKSAVQPKTTQVVGASTKPSDEPISIFEDAPSTTDTNKEAANKKKSKTTTANAKPPQFTVDQIVNVQDRTWPGRNDQGGVAKIIKVSHDAEETKYEVKYILESRKEKNIEERYITEHSEYASPDKNKGRKPSRKTQEKGLPGLLLAKGGKKKQQGPTPGKRAVGNKISDELERIENSRGGNSNNGGVKSGAAVKSNGAPKAKSNSNNEMEVDKSPTQKKGPIEAYLSPSKKDAAAANSPNRQEKKKARVKSPKKSPSRQAYIRANALGLVRVPNPHQIACTSAVAKYKDLPYDPATSEAKRIFPNAILGRSSSKTKSNFVDLGISNKAPGISRNNIKVVEVRGLTDGDSSTITTTAVAAGSPVRDDSQQSQASTASVASSTTRHQPTMTIQVYEKCNGVEVYKTRRGERSNGAYLPAEKQSTLRIGDAIEFISNERIAFCVVGLTYPTDSNKVEGEEAGAARLLDFTPKEKKKASKKVDDEETSGDKKKERSAETDKTMEIDDNDIMEVEVLDKPSEKKKATQESGTQDAKTDESMDVTMDLDDSQRSEVKSDETALQKGDGVKVFFVVDKDMFGDSTREWYFGTVKKVQSVPDSTSKCNVVVNFEDGSSDTYEYPGEDIEKLSSAKDSVEFFPETFIVGDLVDGFYQDGGSKGRWFRGRVASISEDGNTCDILYYDGDVSVFLL